MKLIFYIFLILLFSKCAVRSVFVPTSQNVMLFDDNKQIQANAYVGTNTAQLQLAHNPVKHMVVGLSTNYGAGLSIYEGYLGTYGYSKNNAHWRCELLGGAGYTNNYSQIDNAWTSAFKPGNTSYETISLYNKFFVQPAFGFFSKIDMYKLSYSFSFSCKGSYIDFKKYIYREIDADETKNTGSTVYIVNKEYYNKDMYLLEPCFTNKIGLRNVYAVLQAEVMMPYSTAIDIRNTKFSPVFLFSFGIQYNFIFKKPKTIKQ